MNSKPTRREILKGAAALGFPMILPAKTWANPPSNRLAHASIGADGQGWSDLQSLADHPAFQLVSVCDVDTARMAKAEAKFPQARRYQDWREMLAKEGDKIDSVNIAVPDHMHASIAMAALRAKKHVYCQKPLTHDLAEARALREEAEKAGVVTQMGNQVQSSIEYRMGTQMLRDGVVGKIREIHAWVSSKYPRRGRPSGEDPIPPTLDWDKWLGTAPHRPFKKGVYHSFEWRAWIDFGGGAVADFVCHILDTPKKALEFGDAIAVTSHVPKDWAENPAWNKEHYPDWSRIEFEFPGTSFTTDKTLKVTWWDGTNIWGFEGGDKPPRELFDFQDEARKVPNSGALFLGENGQLLLPHTSGPVLLPYKKNEGLKRPKVEGFSHYHAFIDACLGKGKTHSHFGYAGPLAEVACLGTIAHRVPGQRLEWDAAKMVFPNSPAATALVRRKYRAGWEVPGLG